MNNQHRDPSRPPRAPARQTLGGERKATYQFSHCWKVSKSMQAIPITSTGCISIIPNFGNLAKKNSL